MNIWNLLPTKKVTAFVLGGSLTVIGFWLTVDVFAILENWPEAYIVAAFVILIGFVLAWIVPESAWTRAGQHVADDQA